MHQHEGKINSGELREYIETFYNDQNHKHMVYPGMVYISHPTEKIARVVDIFAHRLQLQERLTSQIKDCIQETLNPMGVMVVIEAQHL